MKTAMKSMRYVWLWVVRAVIVPHQNSSLILQTNSAETILLIIRTLHNPLESFILFFFHKKETEITLLIETN